MITRFIVFALLILPPVLQRPIHAASLASDCESIRGAVEQRTAWKTVARGLELAQTSIGSDYLGSLTLVRYSSDFYSARPYDLRDIVRARQASGLYSPPFYSINDLQRVLPGATLIASGGMTKSLSDPIPAGFLRIDGTTRVPVAPADKILDGVVCFAPGGKISILSEKQGEFRRAPRDLAGCVAGFQAGPVLVADGIPTSSTHNLKTARVILGLSPKGQTIVAFSDLATTAAVGCAMTAPTIGVTDAINLQGDRLGGMVGGVALSSTTSSFQVGSADATIASALIVEPRGESTKRVEPKR